MTELRSAIRKEQAERRAVIEWWFKILGGTVGIVTGLVGALIRPGCNLEEIGYPNGTESKAR